MEALQQMPNINLRAGGGPVKVFCALACGPVCDIKTLSMQQRRQRKTTWQCSDMILSFLDIHGDDHVGTGTGNTETCAVHKYLDSDTMFVFWLCTAAHWI